MLSQKSVRFFLNFRFRCKKAFYQIFFANLCREFSFMPSCHYFLKKTFGFYYFLKVLKLRNTSQTLFFSCKMRLWSHLCVL